jgi:hypothetical protein
MHLIWGKYLIWGAFFRGQVHPKLVTLTANGVHSHFKHGKWPRGGAAQAPIILTSRCIFVDKKSMRVFFVFTQDYKNISWSAKIWFVPSDPTYCYVVNTVQHVFKRARSLRRPQNAPTLACLFGATWLACWSCVTASMCLMTEWTLLRSLSNIKYLIESS